MPDLETFPESSEQLVIRLEGLPTLPRARTEVDFPSDERFVYMFDPTWRREVPELVTGTVEDIAVYDRPFRLGLPTGTMFTVLGREARLLRGEATVNLSSFEPSELPDLPRQIMLNTPELRAKMPSAGNITLSTQYASVGRIIGIEMGDNALIPESFMPDLQADDALRDVWLLDGPEDPERRAKLEEAILGWNPGTAAQSANGTDGHHPRRARRHGSTMSGKVGNIRADRLVSFASDSVSDAPAPSIDQV